MLLCFQLCMVGLMVEFARTKWCVLSGFLASCLAVCVEWCDMFVERFGVGLFAFFFLLYYSI